MEYLAVLIMSAIVFIPMGYYLGVWTNASDTVEVEQAWDDGFTVGSDPDLNIGVSEFDLLIDDLNPVRKDPNHFKKSRGF